MAKQGPFIKSKYEANNGDIYAIRIQPETIIASVNPAPTGAVDQPLYARVSGSRQGYGMFARVARFGRTVGTGDDSAQQYVTIPILTPTAFGDLNSESTITYNGDTYTYVGGTDEKRK